MTLKEFFQKYNQLYENTPAGSRSVSAAVPRFAVAFSGGVDSAYLLYAAAQCGAQVKAYYVKSAFQPAFELEDARRLVEFLNKQEEDCAQGEKDAPLVEMETQTADVETPITDVETPTIEMEVLSVDILSQKTIADNSSDMLIQKTIADNPADRCYYCKKAIFSTIQQAALRDGFTVLLDGTNASDEEGDRPGMRAIAEFSVLSPLRLCGLTKDEIRRLSKEAGLFTWDKPAYACLATRVPSGVPITEELLGATERGEAHLSSLGFRDFRIRYMNGAAKIQLPADQFPKALACRDQILRQLKQDYSAVVLDLEPR